MLKQTLLELNTTNNQQLDKHRLELSTEHASHDFHLTYLALLCFVVSPVVL